MFGIDRVKDFASERYLDSPFHRSRVGSAGNAALVSAQEFLRSPIAHTIGDLSQPESSLLKLVLASRLAALHVPKHDLNRGALDVLRSLPAHRAVGSTARRVAVGDGNTNDLVALLGVAAATSVAHVASRVRHNVHVASAKDASEVLYQTAISAAREGGLSRERAEVLATLAVRIAPEWVELHTVLPVLRRRESLPRARRSPQHSQVMATLDSRERDAQQRIQEAIAGYQRGEIETAE